MRRSLVLIPASLGLVASGLFAAPAHAVSWACDVKVTKLTHGVRAWSPYPTPDPCHLVQAKYEYYANGSVHVVLGSQSQYLNAASDAEDPTGTSAGRYVRVMAVAGGSWGPWKSVS